MQRIEPRRGVFARIVARGGRINYGRELESSGVYALHPRLMFDFLRANRAFERCRHVPKPLAELAVLRAATIVGCEFCIDIGSEYARRSGLSDEQLLALHDAHGSGLFNEDELLVIDLATGMSRTPGGVDDQLMRRVGERLGSKGALELVHLIAWENTRARANVALGFGAAGFSEGKVCAVPNPEAAPQQTAAA
ncbi:MAG TPA: carboxymuconolactone decarboxylase family protein [Solirubrobacterales bacterium]